MSRHCFTGRSLVRLLPLLLLPALGCEPERVEMPNKLFSFSVTLTPSHNQPTGSAEDPLGYISGTSCAASACPGDEECLGFCSVATHVACEDDDGCPTGDYCAHMCAKPLFLDIQALGVDGNPFVIPGERVVHIKAVPGMVPATHEYVTLKDGKAENVPVYIAQVFGEAYLWVEDSGGGHSTEQYGQCNNGKDDDGDGWIDQADPNCQGVDDPLEAETTYATGLSPTLYFENPRIWHLQYTDQVSTSPLAGQNVFVETGDIVVTNVVGNGFYVTDLRDQKHPLDSGEPGFFNSFFFFTHNKPEGVNYGDIVCLFSGGIVEYEGNTQMTFPTYEMASEEDEEGIPKDPCPNREVSLDLEVPDPIDVTELLVAEEPESIDYQDQMMANARALEPYESSLITIRDIDWSNRYIACDADENGEYPPNSDDDTCRDECQLDPNCTQLESFFKYSQMAAYANVGKKFYVGIDMLQESVPLEIPYIGAKDQSGNCPDIVDPQTGKVVVENPHKVVIGDTLFYEYLCPERELLSLTGNLRHIYLCDPKPGKKESCGLQMTMLVPRFDEDFEFSD